MIPKIGSRKTGYYSLLLLLAIVISACKRSPHADFSTDKTEYIAGETIKLSNLSTEAEDFTWTLPNGQTVDAFEIIYPLPEASAAGDYSFKLAAERKGKSTSFSTKSVKVKALSGSISAWTFNNTVGTITVKVDSVTIGTIGQYYQFDPGCGAAGCVTANLSIGVHTVTAYYGATSSSGTVNIAKGRCTSFELQ